MKRASIPVAALSLALLLSGCDAGSTDQDSVAISPGGPGGPATSLTAALDRDVSDLEVLGSLQRVVQLAKETPDPGKHDVLVLDASAGLGDLTSARSFLDAGKPVLFVNVSENDKATLRSQAPAHRTGTSRVFAVQRTTDQTGHLHFFFTDWQGDTSASDFERNLTELLQPARAVSFAPVPAALRYFTVTDVGGGSYSVQGTRRGERDQHQVQSFSDLTSALTYTVFLDVQGTQGRQLVLMENTGTFKVGPLLALARGLAKLGGLNIGWLQASSNFALTLPGGLNPVAASPATGETNLELPFTVGYVDQGVPRSYEGGLFQPLSLTDWKVTTTPTTWSFANDGHYEISGNTASDVFPPGLDDPFPEPNDISKFGLTFAMGGLYSSTGLLEDPVALGFQTQHVVGNVFSDFLGNQGVVISADSRSFGGPRNLILDVGAVARTEIASFTIQPNVGRPPSTPTVTGTVTLAAPAPVDLTLRLASDSSNAVVPATLTVPQNQTTATFSITTNGAGIPVNQVGHAHITVSGYGAAVQTFDLVVDPD